MNEALLGYEVCADGRAACWGTNFYGELGTGSGSGNVPNPTKVNLGVGVYFDAQGKLPILQCVLAAEQQLAAAPKPKGYLPIDGIAAYDRAVQELVFGAGCPALAEGRIATVQTLGGTGGLKVGADFLQRLNPAATVLISDPSWENHRALFTQAGFEVQTYPYYDAATRGVRAQAMLEHLITFLRATLHGSRWPHSQLLFAPTSNGFAAGPTVEFAAEQALLEVIERDAFCLAWAHRLATQPYAATTLPDADAAAVAELLLLPLGMSLVTRIAPPHKASQAIGLWFAAAAVGNALAGVIGLLWGRWPNHRYFALLALMSLAAALVLFIRLSPLERLLKASRRDAQGGRQ